MQSINTIRRSNRPHRLFSYTQEGRTAQGNARTGGKENVMAEETTEGTQTTGTAPAQASGANAQQPEPQGTDWKAEARKWEKRSKENEAKAKKWDEAQAQAPTLEAMQEQIKSLQSEAQAAKAAAAHQSLLNTVSSATGVPASLLKGETEEELTQSANAVKAFVNSNAGGFPEDKGGGASSSPMTREDIDKIKDPLARIRARAEHIELYK